MYSENWFGKPQHMDYHPSSYLSVSLYFARTLQLRSIRPLYSSHGEHEKYKLNQKEPFLNTESKDVCKKTLKQLIWGGVWDSIFKCSPSNSNNYPASEWLNWITYLIGISSPPLLILYSIDALISYFAFIIVYAALEQKTYCIHLYLIYSLVIGIF